MSDDIDVACLGGGPAGLMAAEAAAEGGAGVCVFEAQASVGRKLLVAGKGGLNLTYAEPLPAFIARYGEAAAHLAPMLNAFGPERLRAWAHALGIATVIGSSARVFPSDYKAAPLLRAWRARLRRAGVEFAMRHRWLGWNGAGALRFATPLGERCVTARATVCALGGGSWPQVGADGAWVEIFSAAGVTVRPLLPSNGGFEITWSPHLRARCAGAPIKPVVARRQTTDGSWVTAQGEFVITEYGVEGGAIYTLSPHLRTQLLTTGRAELILDLAPGKDEAGLAAALAAARGARSLATHLKRRANITGAKAVLLREVSTAADLATPSALAHAIKNLRVVLTNMRPLTDAISSAGGVPLVAFDQHLMLAARPGIFCAGEMLDWEAPTGGYLLTGCLATGRVAGTAAARWALNS